MEKITANKITALEKAINSAKAILITGHQNPDADCVGSALGLFHFLKNKGKEVRIILPNRFPKAVSWMKSAEEIIIFEKEPEPAKQIIKDSDLIFSVDYNNFTRTGEMQEILENSNSTKVIIDHHPQPENYYNISFSDTSVSSAAELVYAVISRLNHSQALPFASAESLFAGIMADTGCFAYNSSNPDTYKTVSELLQAGVNKDRIKDRLFDNYSEDRTRFMGYLLSEKMIVLHELRAAIIFVTHEEKEKYNYRIGDSEGLVNLPLSIENIVLSVFVMEHENLVKMSLRSKGNFDVNKLARKYFNGGGHKNAAGGKDFKNSVFRVVENLKNILPEYKEELQKVVR